MTFTTIPTLEEDFAWHTTRYLTSATSYPADTFTSSTCVSHHAAHSMSPFAEVTVTNIPLYPYPCFKHQLTNLVASYYLVFMSSISIAVYMFSCCIYISL